MGYMHYEITRNGEEIQAGYGVEAVCEQDGCDAQIHRGLGCLCGEVPGDDDYGCGGYFCGEHLYGPPADEPGNRCGACLDAGEASRPDEGAPCPGEAVRGHRCDRKPLVSGD